MINFTHYRTTFFRMQSTILKAFGCLVLTGTTYKYTPCTKKTTTTKKPPSTFQITLTLIGTNNLLRTISPFVSESHM